jgi:hypothetical protein
MQPLKKQEAEECWEDFIEHLLKNQNAKMAIDILEKVSIENVENPKDNSHVFSQL